jgi:anaerobic dimethyl sulfoxide reductase subunit C (anchor subunit)/Tat-targeted selenate reductase subunit YnfH
MLLGTLMLGLAGALGTAREGSFKTSGLALVVIGAVLGIVGVLGQLATVAGMTTQVVSGTALVSEVTIYAAVFVVGAIIAVVCEALLLMGKSKGNGAGIAGLGLVVSVAAVFVARLVFYALEVNIGL